MFKKFRKKRFSLKSKNKSTSLKDINIVGSFVHQTAKIMSASAETLDSIDCHSSLVSILDDVFRQNSMKATPPTSVFSSSKRNSLFNSHSYRSESTNNSSPKTELIITNNCPHSSNNFVDEHSPDIDPITEENVSNSEMITSSYMNPAENLINLVIPSSPLQRKIIKHPLKRCYSFNDIDIRRIVTLNKKSESIQTFTSVDATLSVEIINSENSGNYKSNIKISNFHRLITKELYKTKIITQYKIKTLAFKNKRNLHKNNFFPLLFIENKKFNINKIDYLNTSDYNFKMLNYGVLKNCYCHFFKINSNDTEIIVPTFAHSTLNESESSKNQIHGDSDTLSIKINDFPKKKMGMKCIRSYQGDERSEISELSKIEEAALLEWSQTPSDQPSILRRILTNPVVVTTAIIGGLLLLIPAYQKITELMSSAIEKPPPITELPTAINPPTMIKDNVYPRYYHPMQMRRGSVFYSYSQFIN